MEPRVRRAVVVARIQHLGEGDQETEYHREPGEADRDPSAPLQAAKARAEQAYDDEADRRKKGDQEGVGEDPLERSQALPPFLETE